MSMERIVTICCVQHVSRCCQSFGMVSMWSDEVRFIAANMMFVSSMVWNGVGWRFKKVIDEGFFFENKSSFRFSNLSSG